MHYLQLNRHIERQLGLGPILGPHKYRNVMPKSDLRRYDKVIFLSQK